MLQGLILGLSNSSVCLTNCTPAILPYILGGGKSTRNNFADLALFLIGRFSGYLGLSLLAWFIGQALLTSPYIHRYFLSLSEIILGVALIFYYLSQNKRSCELQRCAGLLKNNFIRKMNYYPWFFGLITGINIYPPLLLIFIEAINSGSLGRSMLFFIAFAGGTAVSFIPIPFLAKLGDNRNPKIIGGITIYVIAGYYLIKGIIGLAS